MNHAYCNDRHWRVLVLAMSLMAMALFRPCTAQAENVERAIGLPGILKVGAEYCTRTGECHFVGQPTCTIPLLPPGCGSMPAHDTPACQLKQICRPPEQVGDAPVFVVSASVDGFVATVKLQNNVFKTSDSDRLFVLYKGQTISLADYNLCNPPPGMKVTIIGKQPPSCWPEAK